MGKGTLAIRVAEWFRQSVEYRLECIVPTIPEPAWSESFCAWARSHGVPAVASGHYRDIPGARDESWRADLVFSVFYDRIVQSWFIDRCQRILNLHNGPLPHYRGVSPINWALKNGETSHGVTIHEITPGIDDGPIVAQAHFPINPQVDEVIDVYHRALEVGWRLFEQTMPVLDSLQPRPQDESRATYYSKSQNALLGERRSFTRALSTPKEQA
jgi:methionyl-tRNA formyltransferase